MRDVVNDTTDYEWAELAYSECASYGDWKRTTEELIGRLLDGSEANTLYDSIDKGRRLGGDHG